jgi:hypothetical protein
MVLKSYDNDILSLTQPQKSAVSTEDNGPSADWRQSIWNPALKWVMFELILLPKSSIFSGSEWRVEDLVGTESDWNRRSEREAKSQQQLFRNWGPSPRMLLRGSSLWNRTWLWQSSKMIMKNVKSNVLNSNWETDCVVVVSKSTRWI